MIAALYVETNGVYYGLPEPRRDGGSWREWTTARYCGLD